MSTGKRSVLHSELKDVGWTELPTQLVSFSLSVWDKPSRAHRAYNSGRPLYTTARQDRIDILIDMYSLISRMMIYVGEFLSLHPVATASANIATCFGVPAECFHRSPTVCLACTHRCSNHTVSAAETLSAHLMCVGIPCAILEPVKYTKARAKGLFDPAKSALVGNTYQYTGLGNWCLRSGPLLSLVLYLSRLANYNVAMDRGMGILGKYSVGELLAAIQGGKATALPIYKEVFLKKKVAVPLWHGMGNELWDHILWLSSANTDDIFPTNLKGAWDAFLKDGVPLGFGDFIQKVRR